MKKFLILIFILCVSVYFSQAFAQSDGFFNGNSGTGGQNPHQEPQQQEYKPILSTVENPDAEHNKMLANTYRLVIFDREHSPSQGGKPGGTAFRIHKNWFLTCAHHYPFMDLNTEHLAVLDTGVSVAERPNAPGTTAPFDLVLDMTATGDQVNGKVYLFNRKLQLNATNNGRGDDIALIYVDSKDPTKAGFKKYMINMSKQMKAMQGMVPPQILEQIKKTTLATHKKASSVWSKFINYPINPFKLLILEENTIINELGYPGVTSYYFPLTTYFVRSDEDGLTKFKFEPLGTHKNTHAIFYKRVSNLIPGTSGSPMMYGNFIVSVDSAVNCSPMFTDKFSKWLKASMGKDYTPMCVRPNNPGNSNAQPVISQMDPNWNSALPNP